MRRERRPREPEHPLVPDLDSVSERYHTGWTSAGVLACDPGRAPLTGRMVSPGYPFSRPAATAPVRAPGAGLITEGDVEPERHTARRTGVAACGGFAVRRIAQSHEACAAKRAVLAGQAWPVGVARRSACRGGEPALGIAACPAAPRRACLLCPPAGMPARRGGAGSGGAPRGRWLRPPRWAGVIAGRQGPVGAGGVAAPDPPPRVPAPEPVKPARALPGGHRGCPPIAGAVSLAARGPVVAAPGRAAGGTPG
jgi:hypothetical protein